MENKIRQDLFAMQDLKYKEFHGSLCPDMDNIIGVRIPKLREYAKELYKNNNLEDIKIEDKYYEELVIQGMLIGFQIKTPIEGVIKQVKESVNIPVIGNGDIKSIEDANKMFEYCNVDGIMIGRATIGNPWIINDIIKGEKREISNEEKLKVLKQHIELAVAEKGEYIAVREMRKHICWYIKNLKESSKIREKINRIEDVNELEACLEEYFKSL